MKIHKASNPKSCRVCLNDTEAIIREHLRTGRPCEHPECPLHSIINEALGRRNQQPRIIVHQAQKPMILIGKAQRPRYNPKPQATGKPVVNTKKDKKKGFASSLKQYIKDLKMGLDDLLLYFETIAKKLKNIKS